MTTFEKSTTFNDERSPKGIDTLVIDKKRQLIATDAVSIKSTPTLMAPERAFTAQKSLHINTQGIAALRLPTPPSQLQISIHNPDGSLAYTSTRAKRSSGSCVLADANGKALVGTEYFFGSSKDPVLSSLDVDEGVAQLIRTVSNWTSRSHTFLLPDGRILAWTYRKEFGFGTNSSKGTALVLTLGEKRIAVLLRNNETRTTGSKSCSAGNGGELVLGEEFGGIYEINEDLVVATCLLMLKKEIDRRRTVQLMVIAGVMT